MPPFHLRTGSMVLFLFVVRVSPHVTEVVCERATRCIRRALPTERQRDGHRNPSTRLPHTCYDIIQCKDIFVTMDSSQGRRMCMKPLLAPHITCFSAVQLMFISHCSERNPSCFRRPVQGSAARLSHRMGCPVVRARCTGGHCIHQSHYSSPPDRGHNCAAAHPPVPILLQNVSSNMRECHPCP